MTVFFHLSWMLCALGTVVFATTAARDARSSVGFIAGAVAGVVLSRSGPADPVTVGALAAGAVALFLFRPGYAIVAAAGGGAVAGLWTALLQAQGVPFTVAPFVVATLGGLSMWLAVRRVSFAPAHLVDEGLLVVGVLGIATTTLPSILDGWQTAVALAATSERQRVVDLPMWTAAFILMCTSMGGLYSLWSRR